MGNPSEHQIAGIPYESVLAVEGLPDALTVSYLSGSLVAGYGNAWSDIDVYVVGDRKPIGEHVVAERGSLVSVHYEFCRRIDFEFWDSRTVSALSERLAAFRVGELVPDEYFSSGEEAFIHRLRIGVTTADQTAALEKLRSPFDFELFRRYLIQKSLRWVDHLVEDVCGMVESGDHLLSVVTARRMAGRAVDAYCHFRGSTDSSLKWRLWHLERFSSDGSDEGIRERFLDLLFPPQSLKDGSPAASKEYTDTCLIFVNDVATMVQR